MTTIEKNVQKLIACALLSALTLSAASPALAASAPADLPTQDSSIVPQRGYIGEYAAYECALAYLGLSDTDVADFTSVYVGDHYVVTLTVYGEGTYVVLVDEYTGGILC